MSYRIQIKTSWRWAPYRKNGEIFVVDNPNVAQKIASRLTLETGYETRVVEVVE